MNAQQISMTITGRHYRIVAEFTTPSNEKFLYAFVLRATHLGTGRTSVVNQLNEVLSQFYSDRHPDEWPWQGAWEQFKSWWQAAQSLVDPRSDALVRLETAFDQDRLEGEWHLPYETKEPTGHDACCLSAKHVAPALDASHTTWLTTRELLAQLVRNQPLRVPIQLGSAIYLTHCHPVGTVVMVDEEMGTTVVSSEELLQEYPESLGKIWHWVDPLSKATTSTVQPSNLSV